MTLDQIIDQQQQNYRVLEIIDLSIDHNELFQRLSAVRKDCYDPQERILILQTQPDVYEYIDSAGKHLIALQKICSKLDISNFFITVVTGNADIATELEQIQKEYSKDNLPMNHVVADLAYQKQINQYADTYCVFPWAHLYVGTTGDVLPCCIADQNKPLGNLNQDSVEVIHSSELARQLKLNMTQGYRSKSCETCYVKEDNGMISLRQKSNQKFSKYISKDLNLFDPVYLDIRLNNICNFKCRMCSEWFSSSIAEETAKLYGKNSTLQYHQIDISPLTKQERKNLFEKLLPYISNKIEKIYFAGGEPLLCKEHYDILEYLIDIGHTDLEIFYNTNLSQLSYKDRSVIDLWNKFKRIEIGASVDASGSVAEYVRHGTIWNDILANINTIKTQCSHVHLTVTSTVSLLTASNLIQLQKEWISQELFSVNDLNQNTLTSPEFLSVAALPHHHKQKLLQEIQQHVAWCKKIGADKLKTSWEQLATYMLSHDFSYTHDEFRHRMKILDSVRNEHFEKIFPEYQDLY